MHQVAAADRAEQQLRAGQRPGMALDMNRQPHQSLQRGPQGDVAPAERGVLDEDPRIRVDPAAGDHAQSEHGEPAGVPAQEAGQPCSNIVEDRAVLRLPGHTLMRDDAAA